MIIHVAAAMFVACVDNIRSGVISRHGGESAAYTSGGSTPLPSPTLAKTALSSLATA